MFRLWIEWDFGQDNFVFSSQEKAKKWFNSNKSIQEMYDRDFLFERGPDNPYDYYDEQGLVSIEELEVI
ncbi:MAG: hypothetical protein CL883_05580 [Dehalococcoidia bacterium]|nr:hypothetical protein [Dehalococcoidia bacterium]